MRKLVTRVAIRFLVQLTKNNPIVAYSVLHTRFTFLFIIYHPCHSSLREADSIFVIKELLCYFITLGKVEGIKLH